MHDFQLKLNLFSLLTFSFNSIDCMRTKVGNEIVEMEIQLSFLVSKSTQLTFFTQHGSKVLSVLLYFSITLSLIKIT